MENQKKSPPHVTLGMIAEKADCSRSTVSRALRNHPHIPSKTCERIQKIAKKMGWTPDPEASRLMQYLQSTKKQKVESNLAVLNDCEDRDHLGRSDYSHALIHHARLRAEELGFRLDEIWLRQPGMTSRRVDQILRTRGIKGVLIPPEQNPLPEIELGWDKLVSVATTTTALPKQLNRVLPDNYYNTNRLLDEVLGSGCKRPFLVTSHDLELRTEYAPGNLYVSRTHLAGLKPAPIFYFDEDLGPDPEAILRKALKKADADFVMMPDLWVREWMGEFSDLPVACYATNPPGVLGVDQRVEAVGAAAVDVLSAHVIRGDVGLPELPRVMHIRGQVTFG